MHFRFHPAVFRSDDAHPFTAIHALVFVFGPADKLEVEIQVGSRGESRLCFLSGLDLVRLAIRELDLLF